MDYSSQLGQIGFKYAYEDGTNKIYQKFGKNNMTLSVGQNSNFTFEHEREWPNLELVEKYKLDLQKENKDLVTCVTKLVEWIDECGKEEEFEFKDDDATNDTDVVLPTVVHNKKRKLFIVVWGRQVRKAVPDSYKIEKNFNAAVLYGKKKGIDWRQDARTEEVRVAVMKGKFFPSFMEEIIKCVEANDLHRISINCAKGRHRSVSCAIALKQYYYPNSEIEYLEI